MPLENIKIGQVIQINDHKYVKISRDKYLAVTAFNLQTFTCGEHSTLTATNTCTCDNGYYYDNSGAQTHSVDGGTCGFTACASGTYADSSGHQYTNDGACSYEQCSGTNVNTSMYTNNNTCNCSSGYYANSGLTLTTTINGGACNYRQCTVSYTYDSASSSYKNSCTGATGYYKSASNTYKTGCTGQLSGGFCWDTLDSNTYAWGNRNSGCDSGYSVPTAAQFSTYSSLMSASQIYKAWGLTSSRYYWSATGVSGSTNAIYIAITSSSALNTKAPKSRLLYVRCIKN